MATAVLGFISWFSGLGALAQGLIKLGLGLVINAVVAKLNKQRPDYKELQQEFQQSDAVARGHYGRVLVSGVRAFWAHADGVLHKILILGTGASDGIEQVRLDGAVVALDGSKVVTTPQFVVKGSSVMRFDWRLGAVPSTAYADTVAAFPEWTTDHRLDGLTTILQIADRVAPEHVREAYPTGDAPQVQVLLKGRPCFDPRDDSTAWTENPALQLLDYLTSPDGGAEPLGEFHLPDFEALADLAGEAVTLNAGGSEPRYRCSLSYKYDEALKDVVTRFLGTFNGRVRERPDGKIGLTGGTWIAPTFTIEEQHLIAIEYGPGDGGLTAYSELVSRYIDPSADYTAQTTDPWQDAALVTRLGGVTTETADRLEVPSHSQCRRLDKMQIAFDNPEFQLTLTLRFFGLLLVDQDTVFVNLPSRGLSNVPFWIDGWSSSDDFTTFTVILRSGDPTASDWDETTEEGTPPSYPAAVGDGAGTIPAPANLEAVSSARFDDGSNVPSIVASWSAPLNLIGYRPEAWVRETSSGEGLWQRMTLSDDALSAISGPLFLNEVYEVQVYFTLSGLTLFPRPGVGGAGLASTVSGIVALATPAIRFSEAGLGTVSVGTSLEAGTPRVRLFRGSTISFADAVAVGPIAMVFGRSSVTLAAGDLSVVSSVLNGVMASDTIWAKGTGWSITGGEAIKASGTAANLSQSLVFADGATVRWGLVMSARTAGAITLDLDGATLVQSSALDANQLHFGTLAAPSGMTDLRLSANSTFAGAVDGVVAFVPSGDSLAQGLGQFWVSPVDAGGAPIGAPIGPVALTVI